MAWSLTIRTDAAEGTKAVAAAIAPLCRSGDVLLLIGDLGSGKTVFAQGFAAALGVEGPVTSPTFTLMRQYRCAEWAPVETLMHADVYRTGSLTEVLDLAMAELVEEQAVALVEWGDLAAPALGEDTLSVTLSVPEVPGNDAATARLIAITGHGSWADRGDELATALGPLHAMAAP
jgi:tRNA threonylcarbamoyladenosine biosynthesis protein TsaE